MRMKSSKNRLKFEALCRRSKLLLVGEISIFLLPLVAIALFAVLYLHPQLQRTRDVETELSKKKGMLFSLAYESDNDDGEYNVEGRIKRLELERDNVLADIRQEVNNIIDKTNLWFAMWLAVIAVFCAFLPMLIQYRLYIVNRSKIEQELSYYRDFVRTHSMHYIAGNISLLSDLKVVSDSSVRDMVTDKFISDAADIFEEMVISISQNYNGVLTPEVIDNLINALIQISEISSGMSKRVSRSHRRDYNNIDAEIKKSLRELITLGTGKSRVKAEDIIPLLHSIPRLTHALSRCAS